MKLFRLAVKKTLPVMAGYIVLGTGFGLLLRVNGYGLLWALAMSVFVYAGALQYVGVSLLASGASLITVALTSLMVNARHLFYGISMIEEYKGAGGKKPYLIHTLSDETYSLVVTKDVPEGANPHVYYFWISLLDQCYWVIGSVIGSILGGVLPFDMKGLDFSMTALFVTVFVEQWMKNKEHRPAIFGLLGSLCCLFIFGADNFVVPSMMVIIVILSVLRKPIERKEKEHE